MSVQSKTWWGQELIAALEEFTDEGRLMRGRSYSSDKRIKKRNIQTGEITAKILGNENPYYGIYKAPTYTTKLSMTPLTDAQWKKVIALLSVRTSFISRLLVDEIPEDIEDIFAQAGAHLLPQDYKDFKVDCSCPDWEVPCKHIAGVCYRLAGLVDHNPLLLFEMRGISPECLRNELLKSPLGEILVKSYSQEKKLPKPVTCYFTKPKPVTLPKTIDASQFWRGKTALPKQDVDYKEAVIPAIVIKKGGDYPKFWHKSGSFTEFMEEFYIRMRRNIKKSL